MLAINRKLFRDLWRIKGQGIAISMVISVGVLMFIMYFSAFDSLQLTRRAYYERQRFAHVFASLKRAPLSLRDRIAAIPGVAQAETRVVADVALDVKGMEDWELIAVSSGILIISVAVLVHRYGHIKYPYPGSSDKETETENN